MRIHRAIWRKFHIKNNDIPPFRGWFGTRDTLAEFFNECGYKTGAEIGVQGGHYSAMLCQSIPGLKLKCVDPWTAYNRVSQEKQDILYQQTLDRLAPYGVEIIRKKSMDAVMDIPDGSLDFVYIDGLHTFDSVMMDIIHWARKVRFGGIVSGHDYIVGYQMGIIRAVDAYTHAHNIANVYLTLEQKNPSFFWVKEW